MGADSNLAKGTWADAEAMVGQTVATIVGVDPVCASDIRRKLEVLGFDCALHTDADVAREHGYDDVVAPVSMIRTWVTPAYWSPGDPVPGTKALYPPIPVADVPAPASKLFATNTRTRHLAPVHPGDVITGTTVLESVVRKTTSVGSGAFMTLETTYINQDGVTVAVDELTVFRFGEDE